MILKDPFPNEKFDVLILSGGWVTEVPIVSPKYDAIWGKSTYYYYRKDYGFPTEPQYFWWWKELDAHWQHGDPILKKMYERIRELSKDHKVLLHGQGDMMHPEFIKTLSKRFGGNIYTIYCVDGEPGSSSYLSHPVVYAYDFATTCGQRFDNQGHTCVEKLIEKGALGASWIACGPKYHKDSPAWNFPIDSKNRDIDVIFLGAPRHPTDETLKYPNVNGMPKYVVCKYLKDHGINIHYEPWVNEEETLKLYSRAKIGLNVHGPSPFGVGSSQRLWDYSVCGIMPITDGKGYGIENIFIPNEECAIYHYEDLNEVVRLCKYYLENDSERIRIATNARKRTFNEYRQDYDDSYLVRIVKKAVDFWKETGLWK